MAEFFKWNNWVPCVIYHDKEFHEENLPGPFFLPHDPVFPRLHERVRRAAVQVYFIGYANVVY